MSERPVVIVTRRLPPHVERALTESFDARLNDGDVALTAEQIREALVRADALVPTVGDRLDADVFPAQGGRARIIANYGVGTDHIDLATARSRGMVVTNTPGVLTDCTADLTMALILAVLRRVGEGERELRAGSWTGWRPTHLLGTRVSGRTLGIIGFGRIGRAVARRAHGFAMPVLFHTPHPPAAALSEALGARPAPSLDALLGSSDIVSIHAPATADTHGLIGERELRLMRPGSFLVNTARGGLLDEAALAAALRDGHIAGAGLDVYEGEPAVSPVLLEAPNTVLLPHIGSATLETRTAMGMRAIDNLQAFFQGREPPDRVV